MRAYQVFARMDPSQTVKLLEVLQEKAPAFYAQALAAAGAAMKMRPQFILKQPMEKRAQAVRRALARVVANDVAEEVLATYFLDCRREVLVEWLDAVGLEHEDGILQGDDPVCPEEAKLGPIVESFLAGEDPDERRLLLQAFAAQHSVDWPPLEAILEA